MGLPGFTFSEDNDVTIAKVVKSPQSIIHPQSFLNAGAFPYPNPAPTIPLQPKAPTLFTLIFSTIARFHPNSRVISS